MAGVDTQARKGSEASVRSARCYGPRTTAVYRWVFGAIYEQDFLPCWFGGRPGRGAHHALATLNEIIAGQRVSGVLEADLKNFFGAPR
ncbi:MAG: hypothetical protein C7B45_16695 [Sulfobacillus acidophilus]|uniref:Uncharacterized protein n=1 Tax=Sulfobacillus acidophilus TaxID=53633 RepID=A0A2T2WCW9_9FIRM|nr:MAG: hypothetical protein C7B45_16695 [Sulfobacillus acidophilus]